MKDLDATFNGFIGQLSFNGYRYANITVNGDFRNSLFSGKLQTDDPNLKIRSLDGSINFSGKDLAFNLNSDLDYVNLKNIGLTNEEFTLKGLLSLDFKGNDIDQFLGAARIYDATLTHEGKQLTFDSLRVLSELQDGRKNYRSFPTSLRQRSTGMSAYSTCPTPLKFSSANIILPISTNPLHGLAARILPSISKPRKWMNTSGCLTLS